jgi:hypothetical protein
VVKETQFRGKRDILEEAYQHVLVQKGQRTILHCAFEQLLAIVRLDVQEKMSISVKRDLIHRLKKPIFNCIP